MNIKEIAFVIGLFFLVLFIFIQRYQSSNLAKSICNEVFEKKYNFIVTKKKKERMNHGQLKLICSDIELDSFFVFYPDDIKPYNALYYKIEIGDTLIKSKNSNCFLILNSNKRDSFVFSCIRE
jgi:hypothetical protein